MALRLEFFADPAAFLAAAADTLRGDPVVGNVVASVTSRLARERQAGSPPEDDLWWMVVRDAGGAVVGAAMRTAPFEPRPLFVLPMPDGAAVLLARTLHERGERGYGVNGALPAARVCAEEAARLDGRSVRVAQHTRLFELRRVVPPRPVPGHLRAGTETDVALAREWFELFMADADEQAGRARGSSPHEVADEEAVRRRIDAGVLWFWVDRDGRPVHLTGANPPSFGVSRIGPVFTPKEERGRGYASAAVAEISQMILGAGARPCLFTDQANPTSNHIYEAIGYERVADMVNLLVD